MNFVHDDPEFDALLRIVAGKRRLAPGLVEKDYWVTHTLWALQVAGFDVWFKGGTSLSKGFNLIQRFSEDLDLKVEPGRVEGLSPVSNWKSKGTGATAERKAHFEKLGTILSIPGADVRLDEENVDKTWRSANYRVIYPGRHLADLGVMRRFVQLEVGSARVTPFEPRDMTSFLHEELATSRQIAGFDDNRPRAVRCVHPLVTLLEKLDALHHRFPNDQLAAATFVRHFEDAAHIIEAESSLPILTEYADVGKLADEMLTQGQLRARPTSQDSAFTPIAGARWDEIRKSHEAISPMFWGARIRLEDACETIRGWLVRVFA